MLFKDLKPICDKLNDHYAGKPFPRTGWVINEFVIMPAEHKDTQGYNHFKRCINAGVVREELYHSNQHHPYMDIIVRFASNPFGEYALPEHYELSVPDLLKIIDGSEDAEN